MTVISGGLWQIPFWVVNRLDRKKIVVLNGNSDVNTASSKVFPGPSTSKTDESVSESEDVPPKTDEKVSESGEEVPLPPKTDGGATDSEEATVPPKTEEKVTDSEHSAPIKDIVTDTAPTPLDTFGKAQWERYFGTVEDVKPPPGIDAILDAECKIFPGKKVRDTHLLVLVPKTVDGKDLTLESLGTLWLRTTHDCGGYPGGYSAFSSLLPSTISNVAYPSHWVLITKGVLPGSQDMPYETQEQMVQKIADTRIPYTVPSARDAVVSCLVYLAMTGKGLFGEYYTGCRDKDLNDITVAVGAGNIGCSVVDYQLCSEFGTKNGMAAVRLF